MRTWCVVAAGALLCLLVPACTECGATQCGALPPAIRLTVRDAVDGGPVLDALANALPCPGVCNPRLPDGGFIEAAGSFSVSVEASGYQPQSALITVPANTDPGTCCPLTYVPQESEVRLVPL